jgi:hypothetical protein
MNYIIASSQTTPMPVDCVRIRLQTNGGIEIHLKSKGRWHIVAAVPLNGIPAKGLEFEVFGTKTYTDEHGITWSNDGNGWAKCKIVAGITRKPWGFIK